MKFKKDFVWGAATSAYQIEGNLVGDGRGDSVWDTFCRQPGAIINGDTGEIACQHSQRYQEDVSLMAQMGLQAYRFSVSWPRVMPDGRGRINQQGLDFYHRLVDSLCEKNITPYLTLFHWDLPESLERLGGWPHADSPQWFADFTQVMADKLGDRVQHWITFNETNIFVPYGYHFGIHAPGKKLPHREILKIHRNILLAHGLAVNILRSAIPKVQVGMAPALTTPIPISSDPKVVDAARKVMFTGHECHLNESDHTWRRISWWTDPIFLGCYPEGALLEGDGVIQSSQEWNLIKSPVDFLGVNIYTGFQIDVDEKGEVFSPAFAPGFPKTTMGWPVAGESLYWGLKFLHQRYGCSLYITENGMGDHEWVHQDGKIHDLARIDYLSRYLQQLHRAHEEIPNLQGYFLWSLFDNFEWAYGYAQRFGLIHVDFQSQKRTLKESAHWYKKLIESRGSLLDNEMPSIK